METVSDDPAVPITYDAKIVLLGNSGVGKTSIALRYVQGSFSNDQPLTVGASFMTKRMFMPDCTVKLQIWDTAGQERFRSMTPMYYRGASAAILVYDVTQPDSFECVQGWVRELRANTHNNEIVIAIAGNKTDLIAHRQVPKIKAEEYARTIGALVYETSSKDNVNIENLFQEVATSIVQKIKGRTGGAFEVNSGTDHQNIVTTRIESRATASRSCCSK
eukprot:TRINITY_DN3040_c0_g1_i1.p1 TRINITY_DN3040_c0_g1~~TRINITY_DN3040_c0_g1_i1.p1  ORF type:complete len:219 (+),score=24.52 TRINITY_DN3040_c0_g1_i1:137-793(+)